MGVKQRDVGRSEASIDRVSDGNRSVHKKALVSIFLVTRKVWLPHKSSILLRKDRHVLLFRFPRLATLRHNRGCDSSVANYGTRLWGPLIAAGNNWQNSSVQVDESATESADAQSVWAITI